MKQYKTINSLNKAIDKAFRDIVINNLKYKGDYDTDEPEKVKAFFRAKKIHIESIKNYKYQTEKIVIYKDYKPKHIFYINYKELTLEIEEVKK